jgi:hypothetical protein
MNGEGRLVEIALEFKAGGIDELLIRGIMSDGVLVKMRMRAQRPQVEINNPIGFGKQPGRLGRSFFPQKRREREQQNDDYNNEDGRLGAPSHEGEDHSDASLAKVAAGASESPARRPKHKGIIAFHKVGFHSRWIRALR